MALRLVGPRLFIWILQVECAVGVSIFGEPEVPCAVADRSVHRSRRRSDVSSRWVGATLLRQEHAASDEKADAGAIAQAICSGICGRAGGTFSARREPRSRCSHNKGDNSRPKNDTSLPEPLLHRIKFVDLAQPPAWESSKRPCYFNVSGKFDETAPDTLIILSGRN